MSKKMCCNVAALTDGEEGLLREENMPSAQVPHSEFRKTACFVLVLL